MIAHIVLFNPRPDVTIGEQRSFARKLASAAQEIQIVKRAYVGRSVAIEAGYQRYFGDKTYKYAAVLEFEDRSALIAYLNHAKHRELGQLFWHLCESTTIIEVETNPIDDSLEEFLV